MRYQRVPREIKFKLYQHMKTKGISKLGYSYEPFFNDVVKKKRICVFVSKSKKHFNGVLMRRGQIPTLSYTKTDPKVRQNFTKCHELAHLLLNHQGKSDSYKEAEANRVASFLLMPDIVLLAKIIYRKDTFQRLKQELCVSAEALRIRLIQLLQDWTNCSFGLIRLYVRQYALGYREMYVKKLRSVEKKIIHEYEKVLVI